MKSAFSYFYFLLICLTLCNCRSSFKVIETPTNYSQVIQKGSTLGVLFLENADCFLCRQDGQNFSPSLNEILETERILKTKINSENTRLVNQGDECPIIHRNLNKYRRQYIGYTNQSGDRVIYITFYWNKYNLFDRIKGVYKEDNESWKKERTFVMDGCSYYWQVKVNLETKELFDLSINGVG